MDRPHLIIASGGTGGHFYPTLGVACEFCHRGGRCTLLLGGKHASEQMAIARQHGVDAELIDADYAAGGLLAKIKFLLRLPFRIWSAWRMLSTLNGDLLLTMGSYVAVPTTIAWNGRKKPLVIHEGNTVMGKANRLALRKASAVALTLPLGDDSVLNNIPWRLTGMPLRKEIVASAQKKISQDDRAKIARSFGLSPEKQTVFVFGGSQGAMAINAMLFQAVPLLKELSERIQFLIATGREDNAEMARHFAEAGVTAHIEKIYSSVERCFALSDVVVCRGGASSICELAVYGLPMIIIPLPNAADNHQYVNARSLADRGAAMLISQDNPSCVQQLADAIRELVSSTERRQRMSKALAEFSRPDSTQQVVALLFDVLNDRVGHTDGHGKE